jgi:anthranilate/para-aminobenzoate synthase component II
LRVLLVDHRDSFVHTLALYFREQGADMLTLRTGLPGPALDEYAPDLVVPGPARAAGGVRRGHLSLSVRGDWAGQGRLPGDGVVMAIEDPAGR